MKKILALLLIGILSISMLSACGKKDGKGDGVVIGQTWVQDSLDPTNEGAPWGLTSHGLTETVYMLDKEGNLTSRFVENLEQVDDLNWNIKLKKDVKFADGSPVDAEAFAKALNTVMEKNPMATATAGKIQFTAEGDSTVIATTERPTKVLSSVLAEWTNVVFKQDGENFIFTGPYMVKDFEAGAKIVLEPNKNYPDADKRSNVTIKAFKDETAMKSALEASDIDMAFTVTPKVAKMLKDSKIEVKSIDAGYQYFAPLNLKGVLSEQAIRDALNVGLDRNEYIKVLDGGRVPTGLFAHYNGFNGTNELSFDASAADKILTDAGWVKNDKGVREKDGKSLSVKLVTYPSRPDLGEIMKVMDTQLKALGFETSTEIVENIDDTLKEGNFDIALYAQHTAPTGNPAFFLNQFFRTGAAKNNMGYSSTALDKVLDNMGNLPLGDDMNQAAINAQDILFKEAPVLYLVDPQWHVGLSDKLKDYTPYCGDYYIVNNDILSK